MKPPLFSIKWLRLDALWKKIVLWGIVFLLSCWNYYHDFFEWFDALGMAFILTLQIVAMVLFGYLWLSKQQKFPRLIFWAITLGFTLSRFLIVFFVLQYHLPDWTVFHHPDRVGPFLFITSAVLIFIGYSYSIYEWGLAARQEYQSLMEHTPKRIQQPIVIKSEGKTIRLLPQDIIYLEAKGEYINYSTPGKNHMYFQRMKNAEKELKGYGLLRAHRSFIINPLHVKSFSANELVMSNEKSIPVSKTYKSPILDNLKD
ncbi:MAG: LytTR family DNA-binding domain-containing protein [Bacteroidota bacterium]